MQEIANWHSRHKQTSGQITLGAGGLSASASHARNKIDADHASVVEQSGLYAGDGGYRIEISGHTELTGARITSSQTAQDRQNNTIRTGSLQTRALANHSHYAGESLAANIGLNSAGGWNGVSTGGDSTVAASIAIGSQGSQAAHNAVENNLQLDRRVRGKPTQQGKNVLEKISRVDLTGYEEIEKASQEAGSCSS